MSLRYILTIGWKDDSTHQFSAQNLHNGALKGKDYENTLLHQLQDARKPITIYALEQLFRRRQGGYNDIKKFVSALTSIATNHKDLNDIQCRVDVFSYAFLKGAKNFDFLITENKNIFETKDGKSGLFRQYEEKWKNEIYTLEEFERIGNPLPEEVGFTKDQYLCMRRILIRKSARDERRSLATLLVSGPSTMKEISEDLGFQYTLSQRTVLVFVDINVVEILENESYVISVDKLPMVFFFLRETMGLDYLSSLMEDFK